MDKKLKSYLEAKKLLRQTVKLVNRLDQLAKKAKIPKNIRKAELSDIRVDAIIWHKDSYDGSYWHQVLFIRQSNNDYQATNSRWYKLKESYDDAYVEIKRKNNK